jgi:hypothetical protein
VAGQDPTVELAVWRVRIEDRLLSAEKLLSRLEPGWRGGIESRLQLLEQSNVALASALEKLAEADRTRAVTAQVRERQGRLALSVSEKLIALTIALATIANLLATLLR